MPATASDKAGRRRHGRRRRHPHLRHPPRLQRERGAAARPRGARREPRLELRGPGRGRRLHRPHGRHRGELSLPARAPLRRTAARAPRSAPGSPQARGENVIIMDADATYPVEAIADMVDMLGENDLVRGTREGGEDAMPPINRLGNWIFNKLLSLSHGLEGTDHLSGLYGAAPPRGARAGHRGDRLRHRDRDRDQGAGARPADRDDADQLPAARRREEAEPLAGRPADPRPGDRAAADLQPLGQLHPAGAPLPDA